MPLSSCARVLVVTLLLGALPAAEDIWWGEGEAPDGGVQAPWTVTAPEHAEECSGGHWLQLDLGGNAQASMPADGCIVSWTFQTSQPGAHQIWERYGMESIRSAYSWRIDEQPWTDVPTKTQPFVDLMAPGFWCELAWTHLGDRDLAPGSHRLQLRVQRQPGTPQHPGRAFHTVDCLCVTSAPFHPYQARHPGAPAAPADTAAAARTIAVPVPTGEARGVVDLSGTWSITRWDEPVPAAPADRAGIDTALPDLRDAVWTAIAVPGNYSAERHDLRMAHRVIYRTHLDVPPALLGHSVRLHVPAVSMIGSAFVNGRSCGGTRAMMTDWWCDLTPGLHAGTNELAIVIKDRYYALSPAKAHESWAQLAIMPPETLGQNWVGTHMDFPVSSCAANGILEPPTLEVLGTAYASDVFVQPSVSRHELVAQCTVCNPTDAPIAAQVDAAVVAEQGGAPALQLPATAITVPAHGSALVTLRQPWADPVLWWPDAPAMYRLQTRTRSAGHVTDLASTSFGFREWGWQSDQFTLNGIPWHFHADISGAPGGAEANLALLRQHHQNIVRFWGERVWNLPVQQALEITDHAGMVVRHTGIFDGEGANYAYGLADQVLFDHWYEQLAAWVQAERNHPSLLIWSIENEITFINSRNLGLAAVVEPMVAKGAKVVMGLDPTRPAMVDGGRALVHEDMPVNGCHYDETDWRNYPEEAYTYALAYQSHRVPWNGWGKSIWRLVPDRPVFHGEAYFLAGYQPGDLAQWGGEQAFTGWTGAAHGAGLFARILSEGYRWHGIAAFHFWLGGSMVEDYYNSWSPVAVLVRQWDSCFGSGSTVPRTIKVLNDTHDPAPIHLAWELTVGGKPIASGAHDYTVACGTAAEDALTLPLPTVASRTAGSLSLTLSRGGAVVFHDVKPIAVIPTTHPEVHTALAGTAIAVYDPQGAVVRRLAQLQLPATEIHSLQEIPEQARLVVVGPDALDALSATGTELLAVAARGGRVLMLDQAHPLTEAALPADMEPTGHVGRVAFSENLAHPAFAGLDQGDFFTWAGDEIVYRNPYTKPTHGAVSLAACDQQLGESALAECQVNDGLLVVCQLVVGTKLATNPVAQRLFDNLLVHCARYAPERKATAVALDPHSPRGQLLAKTGLVATPVDDALAAITGGTHQIVIVDGTPAGLSALAAHRDAVAAFTAKGGWLMVWGVTPEGLPSFNAIVGVEHLLRPFRRERVTLPAQRDPVLSGLTMRDVVMDSGEQIAGYSGQRWAASDAWSGVVDIDDIAPFCTYPPWQQFSSDPHAKEPSPDRNPLNLVNGFTSQDDWRYIFQITATKPCTEWDVILPRPERLAQLEIINNGFYGRLTGIDFTLDGDPKRVAHLPLQPVANEVQTFPLPGDAPTSRIHVTLADWESKSSPATVGIDNWWIRVQRSPAFYRTVKPLLNIGALVKYEQGKGGVLLCELNVPEHETNPANAAKRVNLVATLLRNSGAVFAGGKVIVAGAHLSYHPVPLGERCNLSLTREHGWFPSEPADLAAFPLGDNRFSGVPFTVRNVLTSPLPQAITVNGGTPVVAGIPVGAPAAALFFLHTLQQTAPWSRPAKGDRTGPVVWQYRVHYADGTTVDIPVRLEEDCARWRQAQPHGLSHAVVAWTAPLAGRPEQAVVYQMTWTNPHPAVAITSIDVVADAKGAALGNPVVLAVTAGNDQRP